MPRRPAPIGTPHAPEASSSTVSLVEVSPSTEMRLKLTLDGGTEIGIQIGGLDRRVSQNVNQHRRVRHKLRMNHAGAFAEGGNADLARCAIAPAPIQPREGDLLHGIGGEDGLCGLLRSGSCSVPSDAARSGSDGDEFFRRQRHADDAGRRWKDLFRAATEARAAAAQVARAALKPASPAAQLALPALMATTRTRPPVALRCSLSMMSGAAMTRLAVKAAAALAGASATMRAKSGRPLAFRPALAAPNRNPRGMRIVGEIAHGLNPFNLAGEVSGASDRQRGSCGGESRAGELS